jgi:hypothetical protein
MAAVRLRYRYRLLALELNKAAIGGMKLYEFALLSGWKIR